MDGDRLKRLLVRGSILVDLVHRRGDRPIQGSLADRLGGVIAAGVDERARREAGSKRRQDVQGLLSQVHRVRLAGLHPLGGDQPLRPFPVRFRPGGPDELALSNTRQQHEPHGQPQCRRGPGLLQPIQQGLDLTAAQVALTLDKRRIGLPCGRFRRIGDVHALESAQSPASAGVGVVPQA